MDPRWGLSNYVFPKLGIETVPGARTGGPQPSGGLRLPSRGSSGGPCVHGWLSRGRQMPLGA